MPNLPITLSIAAWFGCLAVMFTASAAEKQINDPVVLISSDRQMKDLTITIFSAREKVLYGSTVYATKNCNSPQLRECFSSKVITFGVPINLKKNQKWDVRNFHFTAIKINPKKYNIQAKCVYMIDSLQNHKNYETRFFYSNESGLVGIDFVDSVSGKVAESYRKREKP